MEQAAPKRLLSTLMLIAAIQLIAFAVFHISIGLIFSTTWVSLAQSYDWLRIANHFIYQGALYLPMLIFALMMLRPGHARNLLAVTALGTLYSAYVWQYPMITGFLYSLGQFDSFPSYMLANMPGIDQYPPL